MRMLTALFLSLAALGAMPAHAQRWTTVTVTDWTEVVEGAERFVPSASPEIPRGEAFGPFRVIDENRAALVDATDAMSPRQFAAMLAAHPQIAVLEMVECPGTDDDVANLALGRMLRARGIATHVPADGSVRSGAVELFLAGATRRIDDGAEFAVHSWRDSDGREAGDFSAEAAPNRAYLDYYREMGLGDPKGFYALTNSVPNDEARWLSAAEMRWWVGEGGPALEPTIAYLDLGHGFP